MVSGCMIVRDEAATITMAVHSLLHLDAIGELIVVDTGSVDGTLDILKTLADKEQEIPIRIYEEPWRDDFSLARNKAQELAHGDWIIVLDGDEQLVDPGDLAAVIARSKAAAILVRVVALYNECPREVQHSPRAYKRNLCFWKYPVHNQLVFPGEADVSTAQIEAEYRDGIQRTVGRVGVLTAFYAEHPDDPHAPFFFARTAASVGDWPAVLRWADVLRRLAPTSPAHSPFWYYRAIATWMLDGIDAAEAAIAEGLTHHPRQPDLLMLQMNVAFLRWVVAARSWPLSSLSDSREAATDPKAIAAAQEMLSLAFRVDLASPKNVTA